MFSVIIPAHNEASVIDRCLSLLTDGLEPECAEIIVVCNGCTDDTAERAAKYPFVHVIEVSTASKVFALNTGDKASRFYPIAYVDADVALPISQLIGVISTMNSSEEIMVAAPKLRVNVLRSNIWVKSFYRVWMQLPYFSKGQMVGSGVFILSKRGRKRFNEFPNIISDDGYVRSLFQPAERRMISSYYFKIFAPKTMRDLIKIKTRVRFGNMEVSIKYPSMKIGQDNQLIDFIKLVVRKPWLLPSCMVYIYVQFRTKQLSQARMDAADFTTWERDESSRGEY